MLCHIPVSFPGMRVVLNIRSIWEEHMGTRPSTFTCQHGHRVTCGAWPQGHPGVWPGPQHTFSSHPGHSSTALCLFPIPKGSNYSTAGGAAELPSKRQEPPCKI